MIKRPDLSDTPVWISLEETSKRLSASLGDNTDVVLETIIARGRIAVLAIRSDIPETLPDQVQDLLSKACRISVDAPKNLIIGVFQFDNAGEGRHVFGPRSTWIWLELPVEPAVGPSIKRMASLTFEHVRVCWTDVVRELRDLELWPSVDPCAKETKEATNTLRYASRQEIDRAIREVYDRREAGGQKPPNLNEIVGPVQDLLRAEGCYSSGRHIQDLARGPEHKSRRRKAGNTLASERRRQKAP